MSDIDFDELDKAVNSLMGKAPVQKDDVNPQNTLSISSTLQSDQKPAYDALNKVVEEIGSESLETNSGQSAAGNLSVDGDTARVIKLDQEKLDAAEKAGVIPSIMDKPAAPVAKRPSSGRFMDVVHPSADMRSAPPTSESTPPRLVGPVPPAPTTPATPAPTAPVTTVPSAAQELVSASPFLTDAKVEKRPLGGEPPTGGPVVADSATTSEQGGLVDAGDENSPENTGADQQQTLNAEDFSSETDNQDLQLQNIESAFDTSSHQALQSLESGDAGDVPDDTLTSTKAAPVAATQSLSHPPKQKSGWGIVIIIAVIIVLSIAVAGAAYFFVIKP
ncbi:MAG: hypothetical protein H6797_01535 [Candidatus Nomurabacteria bacterium]|nr:MAG: hypothetical protein H6797_01535 [Candidatus Nomurabacteria bacterium]